MEDMTDTKRVCKLRDKLISAVEDNLGKNVSSKQMGEIIDMIKDLSQCEKDMLEAKYYKSKTGEDDEEEVNFSNIIR